MDKKLIDDIDVSMKIGMSKSWLRGMRVKGGGPPFYKLGNAVRYDDNEVYEWLESRKCTSTSSESYKRAREADDLHYQPKHRLIDEQDIYEEYLDEISK